MQDMNNAAKKVAECQDNLENAEKARDDAIKSKEGAVAAQTTLQAQLDTLQQAMADLQEKHEAELAGMAQVQSHIAQLSIYLWTTQQERDDAQARAERLEPELVDSQHQVSLTNIRLEDCTKALERTETDLSRVKREVQQLQQDTDKHFEAKLALQQDNYGGAPP